MPRQKPHCKRVKPSALTFEITIFFSLRVGVNGFSLTATAQKFPSPVSSKILNEATQLMKDLSVPRCVLLIKFLIRLWQKGLRSSKHRNEMDSKHFIWCQECVEMASEWQSPSLRWCIIVWQWSHASPCDTNSLKVIPKETTDVCCATTISVWHILESKGQVWASNHYQILLPGKGHAQDLCSGPQQHWMSPISSSSSEPVLPSCVMFR